MTNSNLYKKEKCGYNHTKSGKATCFFISHHISHT
ncbi:BnaA03g19200D [Brassica napus]|uniref:(rape) hypothetical protein n=1 Tax=Brassica napus TaxID=3708 RepID=A0A078HAH2_BRANA|nr:unnamed protein product [Brassica napus]CDY35440.1 BnaA03g19200D [Brassica napus]